MAIAALALSMAATAVAASASTSFGPGRAEPLVVTPETALTGFGAGSSEVAVLGEPATRSAIVTRGSRALLAF